MTSLFLPEAQRKECPTLLSHAEQWAADLEILGRIERQREEQEPCFFAAMGELEAGRAR